MAKQKQLEIQNQGRAGQVAGGGLINVFFRDDQVYAQALGEEGIPLFLQYIGHERTFDDQHKIVVIGSGRQRRAAGGEMFLCEHPALAMSMRQTRKAAHS